MLIVLGGLLGSGRRPLARKLAAKFGLYHYDIDRKKLRRTSLKTDTDGNFRVLQPKTDEDRLRLYKNALQEFPLLSKMHHDVIVDDSFHREAPREYFLTEAQKYYASVIFLWIESDEVSVKERLELRLQKGTIDSVADALRSRERVRTALQPPAPSTPRFFYTTSGEGQIAACWELIQKQHIV